MPRAKVSVSAAPNKTRWTLAQNEQSGYDHKELELVTNMQANGVYYDQHEPPLPRYVSYDGSQYSSPGIDRMSTTSWKPARVVNGSGHHEDYDYNTPLEERASHQISLNTRVRRSQDRDAVGQHLLYETAMLDSQSYEMLEIAEVDALKKEQARLNARIEAANRKLVFESKVKDAAQNLQRLYSVSSQNRSDTPQSPDSSKKSRSSLLSSRHRTSSSGSGTGQPLDQAKDELAGSTKKVLELNTAIKKLLERRQLVEGKLLRHTAAVLAEQSTQSSHSEANASHTETHGEDERSMMYSPDEFDGIHDILRGAPATAATVGWRPDDSQNMRDEHVQQMASVQSRLEHLNDQLRYVIGEASRTRGVTFSLEQDFLDADEQPVKRMNQHLDRLEDNVHLLDQEQQAVKSHYARLQDSVHMTRNAVEAQLEGVNDRLHHTLLLCADIQDMESMREPPQATGHGYQQQLQYMSDSLQTIEQVLCQHRTELNNAREASDDASRAIDEAHVRTTSYAQKLDEYEATLGGLWEILLSDDTSRPKSMADSDSNEDGPRSPPLSNDFSVQAFNSRVQHLFSHAQSAKDQQDILRRQIQQQRELNGKSDAEKDLQLTELQGRHDQLAIEHGAAQNEITKSLEHRVQVETEASQSKLELMNVMNEHEELKRSVDTHQTERDGLQRQLQSHQSHATALQAQIEVLEAQVAEITNDARLLAVESEIEAQEASAKHEHLSAQLTFAVSAKDTLEQRHAAVQKNVQDHESEIVRLTTELAIAKAELDGAYGSRAERAREAQAAEVAGLSERNAQMTEELQRLQGEHEDVRGLHQDLTGQHETLRTTHQDLTGEHEALRTTHEATLAELEGLHAAADSHTQQTVDAERSETLEAELHGMTDAFQDLTRESLKLEKERGQLEDLIDGLRDRCDALGSQLNDERVRWLGIRSPSATTVSSSAAERQSFTNGRASMTSTMAMRQEFKKMMREAREEGVKLLRAEQDHRRHLETELRRLRQAHGPLANGGTAAPRLTNGHVVGRAEAERW
ncbi:hypothetical protein LTR91_003096 [Friedmanniomyces endolithicus]|uniref:Up-regulated during septation protein 1 domain-containing protein n=1 Tax=Friedmanniomyces endolithicus TaxID=329885 RepID=A0AAN6JI17_9PEZI|nr:hypothetical protein LTR01_001195 [Friedmanniomyces endolithicus]KAK0325133.1 hypothetical protein LTR82_004120 [Friedmanniomyces endolithicus]KAK0830813.1 hypothetical protein LTR73_003199 [Friedmanniomyces endolithicus]KAK0927743.1 hypothetical protein LTR57_002985 [Friedmanniomyces endolithicus]KAK1008736.1 hypothetical protein LTR91_003096 [Friedmanniomyces endolithicus]